MQPFAIFCNFVTNLCAKVRIPPAAAGLNLNDYNLMLTNIPYWSISFQQPSKLKQSVKVVIKDENQLSFKRTFHRGIVSKKEKLETNFISIICMYI